MDQVEGSEGHFRILVRKHPRYIDPAKCTACGECADVCPITLADEYDQGLKERKATSKKYAQAIPGAFAITKKGTAPCKAGCPAHISVQGYVALVAQGKFREALQLIKEENPLPAICGRVCHHPCESVCTRGHLDEPVAIDFIKRFVADLDLASDAPMIPSMNEKKGLQVAIVGAGPAGLSCAYYLARRGYGVTIFERLPVAGGMLWAGIPEYRLPRDIIEAEIQVIREMDVEFQMGVKVGKDITIEEIIPRKLVASVLRVDPTNIIAYLISVPEVLSEASQVFYNYLTILDHEASEDCCSLEEASTFKVVDVEVLFLGNELSPVEGLKGHTLNHL